jgi:hypothetical protein
MRFLDKNAKHNINGDMLKKVEGSESQQNSAPQA